MHVISKGSPSLITISVLFGEMVGFAFANAKRQSYRISLSRESFLATVFQVVILGCTETIHFEKGGEYDNCHLH